MDENREIHSMVGCASSQEIQRAITHDALQHESNVFPSPFTYTFSAILVLFRRKMAPLNSSQMKTDKDSRWVFSSGI